MAIAAFGCGGSVTNRGIAQVRAISAVSNPSSIDVFTDFNVVALGLGNGEGAVYSSQPAASLALGIRQSGTTTTIASGNLEAGVNGVYSIIPHQTSASTVGIIALLDNASAPTGANAKARLVHVDRNIGSVDLYYLDPDGELADATPVITNINFQQASGYVDLVAGLQKQLILTRTGTKTVVGSAVALTIPSGSVRTLLLLDDSGPQLNIYAD